MFFINKSFFLCFIVTFPFVLYFLFAFSFANLPLVLRIFSFSFSCFCFNFFIFLSILPFSILIPVYSVCPRLHITAHIRSPFSLLFHCYANRTVTFPTINFSTGDGFLGFMKNYFVLYNNISKQLDYFKAQLHSIRYLRP